MNKNLLQFSVLILCVLLLFSGTSASDELSSLVVNTTPEGANLTFNYVLNGTTPATIINISEGNYPLGISYPGYDDYITEIEIEPDTNYAVYISMEPLDENSETGEDDTVQVSNTAEPAKTVQTTEIYSTEIIYSGYLYPYNKPSVIIVNPPTPTATSEPTPTPTATPEIESEASESSVDGSESDTSTNTESDTGSSTYDSETDTESEESSESDSFPHFSGFTIVPTAIPTLNSGIDDDEDDSSLSIGPSIIGRTKLPTKVPTVVPTRPFNSGKLERELLIKEGKIIPTVIPTIRIPQEQNRIDPSDLKNPFTSPSSFKLQTFPAGAEVFLDGVQKGKTPLNLNDLSQGIHKLSIGYNGYQKYSADLMIDREKLNQPTTMQINLKQ